MKFLVRRIQRAAERQLRVPCDYLGRLGESSFSGFVKFLLVMPMAGHRRRAEKAVVHAARLRASVHEDCGPCVQIAVNTALDDGLEPALVRAVLDADASALPDDVALAVRFSDAVLARDGSDDAPRDEIVERLGQTVLAELALAIASARVFPTVKRGLGFAQSCSQVDVTTEPRP